MIVGVISDTHGLLRPEAVEMLRGSEHIIHAGDIGAPEIIPELEKIAPVTAIRGNIDHQGLVQEVSRDGSRGTWRASTSTSFMM